MAINTDEANEAKGFPSSSSSSCVSQPCLLLVFLSPWLHKVLSRGAWIRARQAAILVQFRGSMVRLIREASIICEFNIYIYIYLRERLISKHIYLCVLFLLLNEWQALQLRGRRAFTTTGFAGDGASVAKDWSKRQSHFVPSERHENREKNSGREENKICEWSSEGRWDGGGATLLPRSWSQHDWDMWLSKYSPHSSWSMMMMKYVEII